MAARELLAVLNAGVTTFLSVIILAVVAGISRRLMKVEQRLDTQREIWLRLVGYLTGPAGEEVDFADLAGRLGLDRRAK